MIHSYKYDDIYILLDVESGAVHQVDELVYDVLALRTQGVEREKWIDLLANKHDPIALAEAIEELDELERERILEAPEVVVGAPINAPIKAMCLNIAHDCNLRCRYCFAAEGGYGDERALMSAQVGKAALDFLMTHSQNRHNLEVDFFGGEPLMNFDVVMQLVQYGRALETQYGKKIAFTITTNALSLTDEIIAFCNKEMHNVVISIDGRKEIHDAARPCVNGKGSFDAIIENAKKFGLSRQALGLEYYIRATFTKDNLDFASDVLFLRDLGFEQISVEPVVLQSEHPMAIDEQDLPRIFEEYDRLARLYGQMRKEGKWLNFFHFMIDLQGGPCITKRIKGCGAACEYVAVTPSGDIFPCHQFVGNDAFRIGSVLDGVLDESIRERFARCNVRTKSTCGNCWAKYYCSGGCAANAQGFSGDIFKPYALACEMEKKRLECAIGLCIKEQ